MKRKIIGAVLIVAVLYIVVDQFKGDVIGWYVDNHMPRPTATPSAPAPDQIALTWSGDPQTTQTIQWRAAPAVTDGAVQYRLGAAEFVADAVRTVIADKLVENDPENARFSATLTGLEPGAVYAYRVGSPAIDAWSPWDEFRTAPSAPHAFSFVYLGDPQEGLDVFGQTLAKAYETSPEAAFTIIAGDLVNSGSYRSEWDDFFANGAPWFGRRTLIPALGNHDYDPDAPYMYLDLFTLRENGPADFPAERAYSFTYGNAFFVVLDSNIGIESQVEWLDRELTANADAKWKFAIYHHPAYASRRARDNHELRARWGALFDKHHVDMALQGHDHAYLRTYPMRDGERAPSAAEGTYYVVSVSGTKYYEQEERDYTEAGFEETSTYQVLDIETGPDRLTYRAYDLEGTVRDEVIIEK